MSSPRVRIVEDDVYLDGMESTVAEVVEDWGGEVVEMAPGTMSFRLGSEDHAPGGTMTWSGSGRGSVELHADRVLERPGRGRVALLAFGAFGALLWVMWPFMGSLAALSWTGGVIAICVWLIALRTGTGGAATRLIKAVVAEQHAREIEEKKGDEEMRRWGDAVDVVNLVDDVDHSGRRGPNP